MAGARRRSGAAAVHFPARPAHSYHLVFAGEAVREWAWLDPTELAARAGRWLGERVEADLVPVVTRLIDLGDAVGLEAIERPPGPALPSVVSSSELGPARARVDASTHVLRIDARNPAAPGVGFPGLWCAAAVAGASSSATGGVWFDAGALRLRPPVAPGTVVPGLGAVRMGDHLLLTQEAEVGDAVLLRTKGLGVFGLPELSMRGVPQSLASAAVLVLQGVAQRLVEGLLDDLRDASRRGEVPGELVVTGGHVARAATGARVREAGAARVQLAHRVATADDEDDHLAVEPVAIDLRRPRGEWLQLVLADLLAG